MARERILPRFRAYWEAEATRSENEPSPSDFAISDLGSMQAMQMDARR